MLCGKKNCIHRTIKCPEFSEDEIADSILKIDILPVTFPPQKNGKYNKVASLSNKSFVKIPTVVVA